MSQRFYITTPIYYVNDEAHIGHAYTTTMADVLTRFHALFNYDTFFLTGVDEHGQKVQQAAERKGISPQAHCDQMAPRFSDLWKKMNIQPNDFIRTTEARHQKVVVDVLQKLWDQDLIYAAEYEGYYEVSEERFLTEKEMEEKGYTPESPEVQFIKEKNYFFKMSQYQDWLVNHIQTHPEFIRPESRKNEILGFLKQPLNDLCISRPKSRLSWGIELPFDSEYVTYVWFDALLNYVSAHLSSGGQAKLDEWWTESHHLIGKDILTTHAVYWPTMLHAAGFKQPKSIIAHGWWLMDSAKMSKSKGNVVKPLDLMDTYGVDAFRYFLVRDMALGQDSNFSEEALIDRINSDLANDFGNLLNRTMKLLKNFFDGVIPQPAQSGELENELKTMAESTISKVQELVLDFKLHQALEETLQLVRRANKYMEQTAPWKVGKTDKEAAGTILYHVLEVFRVAATLLSPVIPGKMHTLLSQLGLSSDQLTLNWGDLPVGLQTKKAEVLFPRIQKEKQGNQKMEAAQEKKPETVPQKATEAKAELPEGTIGIEDFAKVELRVAQIKEAERVPKTDKLLRLVVSLGEEERQIVAGIAAHYEPEALIDKKVVVVANLKPVKLRGVESRGMLLAAKKGDAFSILTVLDDVPAGSQVS